MRKDCHICKSEGFEALNRVLITLKGKSLIATLYIITNGILQSGKVDSSESAWDDLKAQENDEVSFSHVQLCSFNAEHSCENVWEKLSYEAPKKSSMIL
jgi:thymidine phosphorylase